MQDHTCAECAAPFTGKRTAKYCSTSCFRVEANRRKRAARVPKRTAKQCEQCGTTFTGGASDRYCSGQCREQVKNQAVLCTCKHCGNQWRPPTRLYYCSTECQRAARATSLRPLRPLTLQCEQCGNDFPHPDRPRKYCGDACRSAALRTRGAQQRPDSYVAAKHRRRALERGSPQGESITPRSIYERDAWRCGICRRKVNPILAYPHPRSASLDHIEPLSLGGQHVHSNVQLAHLDCNMAKSNRQAAQLRLFG